MADRYILGLSAYYHDSGAALLKNGEILAAAQEERFSRKKADERFPEGAVQFCLETAGIRAQDLDCVVFYDKPILKFDRILASYIHRAPLGLQSFLKAVPVWLRSKLWTEDEIRKTLNLKDDQPVFFTEHHQSHAASAFFPSPFQEAAILTIDGAGEWATTTVGVGRGNRIEMLRHIDFPHSWGLLYSAFTYYCGFRVNSGEYKLMGLAPYGQPRFADLIRENLITIAEDGSYSLREEYFNYISGLKMISHKFEKLFGRPALRADQKPDQFYMDVAASIQAVLNDHMVLLARKVRELTGMENLVLAGGVALNCVANERILKQSGFKGVWIQPAAGDAGASLGAALYAHYGYYGEPRNADGVHDAMKGSLLGPAIEDREVEETLRSWGAVFQKVSPEGLVNRVADELAAEKVVGWVQGRMEFGPRALGCRSILGDARSEKMQKVMNLKIKFRESFRPFAPSVLAEDAAEYFDLDVPSPYMLLTAPVQVSKRIPADQKGLFGMDLLKQKRSVIPAVTHVDHSARLQTVHQETNPLYHSLLAAFKKKTGSPVIINTSFNVRGEPIVCTPADAYRCFLATNMDLLAVGNYLVYKADQPDEAYKKAGLEDWKKTLVKD